jgi:hypothetical protein
MAGTTSVPPIVFTPTGVSLPSDADILAGVQADMNAAFGGNLNPSLSTPQGQLATSQAACISDKNAKFAQFVAQVDPDTADGVMQDAIGRIYFLTRRPATPTAVNVDCMGLAGVTIPVGALVQDSSGNTYSCTNAGTIPVSGTITLPFAATVTGPTPCPTGSISGAPYRAIPGWDRATNSTDGVPGTLVESRADFEYRRKQSVAINGKGSLRAIYANVFNLDGVNDVFAVENTTGSPLAYGSTSYSLAPHSLYVAVVGGNAADIAKTIWTYKDVGADYNGNTSVSVVDDSGYNYPFPTYTVKFQIPTSTNVKFAVQLVDNPSLPADIVDQVKAAIVSAFSGGDGGPRARIGGTIYASRFYSPVAALSSSVSVLSLLIGTTTATLTSLTMGIDQVPVVDPANITVTLV